ncbi:hypothetical protein CANINC_002766 [Pichia inconspicua]|uniref:Major facilitator superfamily (MFS) profile domain-containing protein n=1 Tax=Pichia inconspicua TaxID=52247 RepID=A0A4T0X089_9ASCO|nr:hypothetical protein CANINC_002766 [[Candida] inconspicua]
MELMSDPEDLTDVDFQSDIENQPTALEYRKDQVDNRDDGVDGLDDNKQTLLRIQSISPDEYTILTSKERLAVALLLAVVGICSSMAMSIYWTALTDLEKSFNTTEERINYTVTAYLCLQAVAPVFISSLSDIWGRRPVILVCIIGGIATNIGLAVSRKYWLLIFLRAILAICVSPLISIVSACVGDFTTKRNRGGLNGLNHGFTLFGQGFSPFLGALMDTRWSWPAIFWFSAALQGLILFIIFFCLPETHRGYVGNQGVFPKSIIHKSPAQYFYLGKRCVPYDESLVMKVEHKYAPWKPLRMIGQITSLFVLLPTSLLFTIWTISQTSMSVHLRKDYNYSILHIGLSFFAPGLATVTGTFTCGKVLDILYKKRKQKYDEKYRHLLEKGAEIPPFNIIKVRLLPIPICAFIICSAAIIFGWCLQNRESPAIIIVMSFLITFFCMSPMTTTITILIDMHPHIAGGVSALNNLFRCVQLMQSVGSFFQSGGDITLPESNEYMIPSKYNEKFSFYNSKMSSSTSTGTMGSSNTFKLLTFNTWGLKYVSKFRKERLTAIADRLANDKADYDIIALQEVWTTEDWEYIDKVCASKYKYRRWFSSGILSGPGLAILSKFPIRKTMLYRFPINGRPSAFFRGDWYVGKSVAVSILQLDDGSTIGILNSHMHAPYALHGDAAYDTHRTCQAWEIATLIEELKNAGHAVVLVGDLNCRPGSLQYKILEKQACLVDSWEILNGKTDLGEVKRMDPWDQVIKAATTCDSILNTWRAHRRPDEACRLDYALIDHDLLDPIAAGVEFTEQIPNVGSYSDHFAYTATFKLKSITINGNYRGEIENELELLQIYEEMKKMINNYIEDTLAWQRTWRLWHFIAATIVSIAILPVIIVVAYRAPWSSILFYFFGSILFMSGVKYKTGSTSSMLGLRLDLGLGLRPAGLSP